MKSLFAGGRLKSTLELRDAQQQEREEQGVGQGQRQFRAQAAGHAVDVGIAAGEGAEQFQRVLAAAAREYG